MSAITQFLPKNHLSFIVGLLVHLPLPKVVWTPLIYIFSNVYKINLSEAEHPVEYYSSLGEFFVRRLKPEARPLGQAQVLHPADALITQAGLISNGRLVQAKDKTYSVKDLIFEKQNSNLYADGVFLTYYLCPTDYHRVHSPVDGVIERVIHIPGQLWPVNSWSTENIEELFSINERVYVEIKTDHGYVGVVFVGATNVGQIELSFDSSIRGNQLKVFKPLIKDKINLKINKGDELGLFRMGSTVVMLYAKGVLPDADLNRIFNLKGHSTKVRSNL